MNNSSSKVDVTFILLLAFEVFLIFFLLLLVLFMILVALVKGICSIPFLEFQRIVFLFCRLVGAVTFRVSSMVGGRWGIFEVRMMRLLFLIGRLSSICRFICFDMIMNYCSVVIAVAHLRFLGTLQTFNIINSRLQQASKNKQNSARYCCLKQKKTFMIGILLQ